MAMNTSDETKVKVPKREVQQDFSHLPYFDIRRYMEDDTEPEQSISPLEKGYEITESHPFTRNLSENLEGLLDVTSPLDDIYEASGGEDPYINFGLDMLGPAELAKGAIAGAKGAATIIPLLKSPKGNVVRLFHGSPYKGLDFEDPLEHKNIIGMSYGKGLYQTNAPSKAREFTRNFAEGGDKMQGSIYVFEYPEEEFKNLVYRPDIGRVDHPQYDVATPTLDRILKQDELISMGAREDLESLRGARRVIPKHYFADETEEMAKKIRDDWGMIGSGPYYEFQAPEWVMTKKDLKPNYEILLAPEDYTMPNLQFDKQILFDKFKTTTNPTKYK